MDDQRYKAKAILEPGDLRKYSSGGMRDQRYEVENDAVRKVMNQIAQRIGGALDTGWGFLLMLFSYDDSKVEGGGLFYISSAERGEVAKMVREWLAKQEASDALHAQELNPDDATTKAVHQHWHKIVALMLLRMAQRDGVDPMDVRVNFKQPDIDAFAALAGGRAAVGIKDDADGLTLFLSSEADAVEQIKAGKAQPGRAPVREETNVEGS